MKLSEDHTNTSVNDELQRARRENDEVRSRTTLTMKTPSRIRQRHSPTNRATDTSQRSSRERARPIYLINDAVNPYPEIRKREELFRHPTRGVPFVLVCVPNSADGGSSSGDPIPGLKPQKHDCIDEGSCVHACVKG